MDRHPPVQPAAVRCPALFLPAHGHTGGDAGIGQCGGHGPEKPYGHRDPLWQKAGDLPQCRPSAGQCGPGCRYAAGRTGCPGHGPASLGALPAFAGHQRPPAENGNRGCPFPEGRGTAAGPRRGPGRTHRGPYRGLDAFPQSGCHTQGSFPAAAALSGRAGTGRDTAFVPLPWPAPFRRHAPQSVHRHFPAAHAGQWGPGPACRQPAIYAGAQERCRAYRRHPDRGPQPPAAGGCLPGRYQPPVRLSDPGRHRPR